LDLAMSSYLVIAPTHGDRWAVHLHGEDETVELATREAAETAARRLLQQYGRDEGDVVVHDAYHRVISRHRVGERA
jgi:hypothetical protein